MTTATCPSWCAWPHEEPGDTDYHETLLTRGESLIDVELTLTGGEQSLTIWADKSTRISAAELIELAADVLTAAARMASEGTPA